MGYSIIVSRVAARDAVRRGVAELVELDPGRWVYETGEDEWNSVRPVYQNPLVGIRIRVGKGPRTVTITDSRCEAGNEFWANCSDTGAFGLLLRFVLREAGIPYRMI